MITNRNGEKTTPKKRAAELLAGLLDDVQVRCQDANTTERERNLVDAQIESLRTRLYRTLRQPVGQTEDAFAEDSAVEDDDSIPF